MGMIDRWLERRGFVRQAPGPVQKTAGFMELETSSHQGGKIEPEKVTDYRDFIDAFRQLPWIYAAASAVAIAITKPPLQILRTAKDGEAKPVRGEEINLLLDRPNSFLSRRELLQITAINLMITGNQYWNLVGTRENTPIGPTNKPVELWWVKPEQITMKPGPAGEVKNYIYTSPYGKELPLDPSEIIHFRLANPDSYFLGLGMVEPAKMAAILEFSAQGYNRHYMENDATPNFLFTNPNEPTPESRKRFWTAWDERHKGPKKAGRAGMIWGGMDVKNIGSNPKDAQYIEMRKLNREEILAAMGVPPSIVGLLEYANYSNMEVQQRKFWDDTVIPIAQIITDKLTLSLAPHFGEDLSFAFDFSGIKALQEDEERKSRVANTLISCGVKTPNEVIREMYKGEEYPEGELHYISMSLVPIGGAPEEPANGGAAAAAKRAKAIIERGVGFWQTPEKKKVLWESFVKRLQGKERAMIPRVESYLKRQAREVAEKLGKFDSVNAVRAQDLFDRTAERKRYAKDFHALYLESFKRAGDAGLDATHGKIYIPPEERKIKATGDDSFIVLPEHLTQVKLILRDAGITINDTTWDEIMTYLEKARTEAWTLEQLTQELKAKLDGLSISRSRLIAHTEMNDIENWGQVEGYKQNEYIEYKGWLCSMLPTSREAHIEADKRYSDNPIPLDDSFEVDGEMLAYPGDRTSGASAGNVCECKCTTYPAVRPD